MELKSKFEEYTEAEFLALLKKIWAINASSEVEHDALIEHVAKITEHPEGNGLIFYPKVGVEDSPEGLIKEVKEWRAANGKPGFKSA